MPRIDSGPMERVHVVGQHAHHPARRTMTRDQVGHRRTYEIITGRLVEVLHQSGEVEPVRRATCRPVSRAPSSHRTASARIRDRCSYRTGHATRWLPMSLRPCRSVRTGSATLGHRSRATDASAPASCSRDEYTSIHLVEQRVRSVRRNNPQRVLVRCPRCRRCRLSPEVNASAFVSGSVWGLVG